MVSAPADPPARHPRRARACRGRFKTRVARTVQIAGRGSIPSDVVAVTGNLTAPAPTGARLRLGRADDDEPSDDLDAQPGQGHDPRQQPDPAPRAPGARPASSSSVPAARAVHLVFDVTGYYRTGNAGAEWYPVDAGPPARHAGGQRPVRRLRRCDRADLPADRPGQRPGRCRGGHRQPDRDRRRRARGYVSVGPTMDSTPTTSTLNVSQGPDRGQRADPAHRLGRQGRRRVPRGRATPGSTRSWTLWATSDDRRRDYTAADMTTEGTRPIGDGHLDRAAHVRRGGQHRSGLGGDPGQPARRHAARRRR